MLEFILKNGLFRWTVIEFYDELLENLLNDYNSMLFQSLGFIFLASQHLRQLFLNIGDGLWLFSDNTI